MKLSLPVTEQTFKLTLKNGALFQLKSPGY